MLKRKSDKASTWLFLAPALIFLAITALFPLLYSFYLSFFKLKLNLPNQVPAFVCLDNYIRMFTDSMLHTSTWNTILFAVISVTMEVVLGLMLAMILCSDKMWARIVTSLFMIPMIMAPVAIGTMWRMMLDGTTGVINYLLGFLGIAPIQWLSNATMAKIAVLLVNVWQLTPWVAIICVAGLKALPSECIQAALVDGATPRQIFWRVVLPLVKPVLIIVVMMRFTDAFKVFDTIYTMTNGGPGTATKMLPNYIYSQGLRYFDAGYAAALALVFIAAMSVLSGVFMAVRRRIAQD